MAKFLFYIALAFVLAIFTINSIDAVGSKNITYDLYPSTSINTTLWGSSLGNQCSSNYPTICNYGAVINSYTFVSETSIGLSGGSVTLKSNNIPNLTYLKTINFQADVYKTGVADSILYLFGNIISRENSGAGADQEFYNWTANKTGNQWSVYRNNIFNKTVTAIDNTITLSVSNAVTSGVSQYVRVYYVNYTYDDNIFNISAIFPTNNSIQFQRIDGATINFNVSLNTYVQTNLKNISLYINNIFNQSQTVTGINNFSNFTKNLSLGNYNWSVYVCEINNACNFSDTYFLSVQSYNITSNVYNNQTIEGSIENFYLNITIPSGSVYSSVYLNYNNIDYLSQVIYNGNDKYSISRSINVPYVTANTNKTFFWIVNFGGNSYNTTKLNQTVLNLDIDNCSSYTNRLYNFSFYDQDTKAPINSSFNLDIKIAPYGTDIFFLNYSKSYENNTQTKNVCLNIPLNNSVYSVYITSDYQAVGYVKQFYFSDNETISRTIVPKNISLYDLLLTSTSIFYVSYSNEAGNPIPNAIVHLWRYYIGEGLYREVDNGRTDTSSSTPLHLIEEDVIYYFTITYNNQLLYTTPSFRAVCLSNPCTISISALTPYVPFPTNWDTYDGTSITTYANKTSRLVYISFISDDVHLINGTLYTIINGQQTIINSTSLYSTAGTLSMYVPYPYGNQTFYLSIYQDNNFIRTDLINLNFSGKDIFGLFGIFMIILMIGTLVLMASSDGVLVIIFTIIGVIIAVVLLLLDMAWVVIVSIILAGGLIIWKLTQRKR